MVVDVMDMIMQDAVLPTRATVKVPANRMEKTLETRRYATVTRKTRKQRLSDTTFAKQINVNSYCLTPPPLFNFYVL